MARGAGARAAGREAAGTAAVDWEAARAGVARAGVRREAAAKAAVVGVAGARAHCRCIRLIYQLCIRFLLISDYQLFIRLIQHSTCISWPDTAVSTVYQAG